MKRLVAFFIFLALTTTACGLDFNPPPLSFTQPAPLPSSPPVLVQATTTFVPTEISPTPSLPAPTETVVPPTQPTPTETVVPPTQPAPTEPSPTALPTETQTSPVLTVEQLRNASISVLGSDQMMHSITLNNGTYATGADRTQPGYVMVNVGEIFAFGDLNSDGMQDAVMLIGENYGGSGEFVSIVVMLNQGGQPVYTARATIEDRPIMKALTIKDGEISLDAIVHGPDDPMCCAAQPSSRTYHFVENNLILSHLTSTTPSGTERIIQIDSPLNQSEVSGPFMLQGSVSISPFENNLIYSVYTQSGNDVLEQGSFNVSADGLGGPGIFDLPLDFTHNGLNGPLRIQIADLSAADGSYLAIDSVYLILK